MLTAFSKLEALQLNAVPNGMDLLQRVEQIERVLLRLAAQIAALERQGSSAPLHAKQDHIGVGSGSKPEAANDSQDSLLTSATSTDDQEQVPPSNAHLPLTSVELAPEDWTKGITTRRLVARLQTNPATLKKYLRDFKQRQWAVPRDPDGLAWTYDPLLEHYYPVPTNVANQASTSISTPNATDPPESCERPSTQNSHCEPEMDAAHREQYEWKGGLTQSQLSRLTAIPNNTLQRWKHLPDCSEQIRCRTEGTFVYGYSEQNRRFYHRISGIG